MNPLSSFTYYRRHKRSTMVLASIIALVTLGVGAMVGALDSFMQTSRQNYSYSACFSRVEPSAGYEIDPAIAAQVRANPDVARVIPENGFLVMRPTLAALSSIRMMGVPVEDMRTLLNVCGLRVKEGRLPEARANEIVLSEELARSLGLRLGDRISRAVNERYYYAVAEELVLVGVLEQDPTASRQGVLLGLMSYEYLAGHEAYAPRPTHLVVVPQAGRRVAVSRFLEALPATQVTVETEGTWNALLGPGEATLYLIFGVVDALVAGVVAVVAGAINQIAITRRLPEFGLLQAVGWLKRRLVRRVTAGTAVVAGIGWLVGLAGIVGVVFVIRASIYTPHGWTWNLSVAPFLYTLPIPLAVVAFAAGSVWRVFGRLDAVAIIERGKLSMEEARSKKHEAKRSSVKPLSSWTFYLRHRQRGFLLVAVMALMIVGVTVPVFFVLPVIDAQMPSIEYLRYVSAIVPGQGSELDPAVVTAIRANPDAERVVPAVSLSLAISVPPVAQSGTLIYAVSEEDMPALVDVLRLRLTEGRLPRPRTNEIVISEALARNRGLRVGDSVGHPVYKRDGIPTEMTIVGLLAPDNLWMGFISLEYVESNELTSMLSPCLLVVPAEGHKEALDAWLMANVDGEEAVVRTYDQMWREFQQARSSVLLMFGAFGLMVAFVGAVALAVLNAIFFSQRHEEFGVLHALGRGREALTWRAGRETLSVVGAAWLIGAVLCVGMMLYAQFGIYVPKGLSIDFTSIAPWLFTLPIPLAVVAASVGTIGRMLSRLDPVTVIEGRQ